MRIEKDVENDSAIKRWFRIFGGFAVMMSVVMLVESAFFKFVMHKSAFEHAFELDKLAAAACTIVVFSAIIAGLISRNYERNKKES